MKRLYRSITLGVALCLLAVAFLTSPVGAEKPSPTLTVGSVAYDAGYSETDDGLQALDLNWTGIRPDMACVTVWLYDESASIGAGVCENIAPRDGNYPQHFNVAGSIGRYYLNGAMQGGLTSYKLQVNLFKYGAVLASSDFYAINAGEDITYTSP